MSDINNIEEVSKELTQEQTLYKKFWDKFLSNIGNYTNIFSNTRESPYRQWIGTGTGVKNCNYEFVVTKKHVRIEIYVSNKDTYNKILALRSEIESSFGDTLSWQSNENEKIGRIFFQKEGELFNFYDVFNWDRILNFFYTTIDRFVKATQPVLLKCNTTSFKHNYSPTGYSFVEAAKVVFEELDNPNLTSDEVWNYILEKQIPLKSKGDTPKSTLQSHLQRYSDNTTYDYKVEKSVFTIVSNNPTRFKLRRYVPIAVRESLIEYGFIHINELNKILEKNGIKTT